MARRFPDARVTERHDSGTRAVVWEWSRNGPARWLHGSISDDRAAIYLKGHLELVCELAAAAVELFPTDSDVVFGSDSQGIVFDLRRLCDPSRLADAVMADDDTFAWRDSR